MLTLDSTIENLPRVGGKILPALKKLGIRTIRDLLFHFPSRYEDYSKCKPIFEIVPDEIVTVSGRITKIRAGLTAKKHMRILEATIADETGTIKTIWYNQPFLAKNLREGDALNLSGKVVLGKYGLFLQNPAYEKIYRRGGQEKEQIHTGKLVAIYPETLGITSRWLRFLIKSCIRFRQNLNDPLPAELKKKYELPNVGEALQAIHFPKDLSDAERARARFYFESLFLFQLHALRERLRLKQHRAVAITPDIEILKSFAESLPYTLTSAQKKAIWEIARDISRPHPMNRLLEGDVGSGKTVVAGAAALLTMKQGKKTAFLSPTEILARQHFETLRMMLAKFGVKIGLLTASEKKYQDADIIVGTHALIQKNILIKNLGLVVVDEQHRFGVKQRAALLRREIAPHFLSLSATPIPRTLLLTVYGDLDVSLLDEAPRHKKEIITKIVKPEERNEIYNFVRKEVERGGQVFVVCPRIELSAPSQNVVPQSQQKILFAEAKAVKEEYRKLSEDVFPDLRIGMLHGKMKSAEKKSAMEHFRSRQMDILVSTSVIEVGVDVPNATIIWIEGAERFGLAQLHQFRGRIGRGAEQSYCFLFPGGEESSSPRLQALLESKNGFELAEHDLKIRGPGDILGTAQSGQTEMLSFAIARPELVRAARFETMELLKKDPELKLHPELRKELRQKENILHLE